MRCLRLQGKEAEPPEQMWMGMSQILLGGHTTLDASPMEKLYLVVEGEVCIVSELDGRREEHVLQLYDSCRLAPGEKRQLVNRGNRPAVVILITPTVVPS
jgi:hypothetical protein